MSDYQPIACAAYDIFEIAIMKRQVLDLSWRDEKGESQNQRIIPLDLKIEKGAEYLLAEQPGGDNLMIRLDHILRVTPEPE